MSFIYLIVPVVAVLIAQGSKFFISKNRLRFSLKNLIAYSGMPSGHAALTVSLAMIIGLRWGFGTPVFALAFFFTFLTLRDAMGIRQYIGRQGKVLNELVEDLNDDAYLDDTYPHMLEKVGHTPKQLLAGAIIGFVIACLGYILTM